MTHTTRCALYADGYTQVIKRIKLQGLKRKEQEEALNEVRDTGTVRGTEADSRRITHTSHTHTHHIVCCDAVRRRCPSSTITQKRATRNPRTLRRTLWGIRQVTILKSMHNDHIVRYYDSFIGASAASARPTPRWGD